jgi:polyisoprenoid-binding protein YceI
MKTLVYTLSLGLFFVSCSSTGTESKQQVAEEVTAQENSPVEAPVEEIAYELDVNASKFVWIGSKPTEDHRGQLKANAGVIGFDANGAILHGAVDIDMNSITVDDIEDAGSNAKLVKHLKNEDFFNVENFPNASLAIEGGSVMEEGDSIVQINGNLIIKGISNPISINENKVVKNGSEIRFIGSLVFDRTQYDIKYKSKTIFPELADKFINDEVKIEYDLVFKEMAK